MPGKRSPEQATLVTLRTSYRSNIAGSDTEGPSDVNIPIINTKGGPNSQPDGSISDCNQYGKDARILVAARLDGNATANLQLWLRADLEDSSFTEVIEEASSSSSSSSSSSVNSSSEYWVLAAEKSIDESILWVVKDIPPGIYKILVTDLDGNGIITLRTQFAA